MNKLKLFAGFIVSGLLVLLLITQIKWDLVLVELQQASLLPFVWVTGFWIANFVLRAWRWKYLLPQNRESSLGLRFNSLMVGNLATFVLPLRAGEFIRPFFLTKFSTIPFSESFVSVVIERFFDLVCVLSLFFVVSLYVPNLPSWAIDGVRGFSVLAAGILLFILMAIFIPRILEQIVEKVTGVLPRKIGKILSGIAQQVLTGAQAIGSFRNLLMVIVLSIFVWITNLFAFDFFLEAVGIPRDIGISSTLTVLVALAVAAPSAPGFIGVYQVASIAAFGLFGISAEKATAYSLLSHLHQYVMIVAIGAVILIRSGTNLSDLKSQKRFSAE